MVGGNWTLATAYRYLGRIDEEKLDFAGEISGIFTKNHIMTNNSLMLSNWVKLNIKPHRQAGGGLVLQLITPTYLQAPRSCFKWGIPLNLMLC